MSVEYASRPKKTFALAALGLSALLLTPGLWVQMASSAIEFPKDIRFLLRFAREERKLLEYGNRNQVGYGYLRQIVEKIPDPEIFPVVRYPYYYLLAHILYPGNRNQIDPRILVGIDLSGKNLTEIKVADAVRVSKGKQPGRHDSAWIFMTQFEYDKMTALEIGFQEPFAPGLFLIRALLFHSLHDQTKLGEWAWERVALQNPLRLVLDKPLPNFSFTRGSLPFVLAVEAVPLEGGEAPDISAIQILGVQVDLSGYTVVSRDQNCFTAVETKFLNQTLQQGPTPWREFIKQMVSLEGNSG